MSPDYEYLHPDGSTRSYRSSDPEAGKWVVYYKHPNAKLWMYMETVKDRAKHQQEMALRKWPKDTPVFHYTQIKNKE